MANGLVGQPVGVVPISSATVQVLNPLRGLLLKPDAEQVGEQVVIAPPAAHVVEWY